jgi:3-dehydroquinate dehydratase / shikimate dehydrogenase
MTDPAPPARATLVATLTAEPAEAEAAELGAAAWLEVRADLAPDLAADPAALRRRFPGKPLLYTLRSRAEGGGFEATAERRRRRLADAAPGFDLVDLEAERDLAPDLLAAVPPEKRIVSWHGAVSDAAGLATRFARMATVPARLYKLVPAAAQSGEELAPLVFLHGLRRGDVAAFASGAIGAWTRLVAPRLGAPVVYGAVGATAGAPGQIPLARLVEDYGLPELAPLAPIAALYGIVGNPVSHSLSPRLHNGAYRALGLAALYLPFHAA